MDIRRARFGAAVRLAMLLSLAAAALTIALEASGDVSPIRLVSVVMIVGFVSSWVVTGRVARSGHAVAHHRVAVIPLRHHVG